MRVGEDSSGDRLELVAGIGVSKAQVLLIDVVVALGVRLKCLSVFVNKKYGLLSGGSGGDADWIIFERGIVDFWRRIEHEGRKSFFSHTKSAFF